MDFREQLNSELGRIAADEQVIADMLLIARSTLRRWQDGKNVPGANTQRRVIEFLKTVNVE